MHPTFQHSFTVLVVALTALFAGNLTHADSNNYDPATFHESSQGKARSNDVFSRYAARDVPTKIRQNAKPDESNGQTPTRARQAKAVSLTYIDVRTNVIQPRVKRLGMNVGARDIYGAAQYMKNLIPNPGFESGEYGTLLHVGDGSTGSTIYQSFWDTSWNIDQWGIGQPEGFWDGGTYEFLFGPAKGRTGTINHFSHSPDNRYTFELDSDGVPADSLDVMSARKVLDGIAGYPEMDPGAIDTTTIRPGSPGTQSLRLQYSGAPWISSYTLYMDSFWRDSDPSAGKMMIVEGPYRLAFWAKGSTDNAQVRIEFRREGEGTFFNETVNLTTDWQRYEFNRFIPVGLDQRREYAPDEYRPLLVFRMFVNDGNEVWMDDLELYKSSDTNPTAFCDAFVEKLNELRPGVLRDWGNQLGSSLDNQLAEPFARKTIGWRPHSRVAGDFSYSLHEFLELCKAVGSEPWYVIPPTFTADEMVNLCEYLCAPADPDHPYAEWRAALGQPEPWINVFPMIHLEWGNEMWGAASGSDPFFGASAFGGERLGQMASDRFGVMRDYGPYFDAEKFNFILGGQVGWPGRQRELGLNSENHQTIALAPYFGSLDTWNDDTEIFPPLFAKPFYETEAGNMRQSKTYLDSTGQGTRMAIYEINFHTTGGDAPLDIRNDFVTSMAGGVAMPLYMLEYQKVFAAREQCAFQALQHSFHHGGGEHVKIWGCLRDLNATGRKRPTWLGMEVANKAIQGDMIETVHTGIRSGWTQPALNGVRSETYVEHVKSYAFRDGKSYGIVVFNLDLAAEKRIRIGIPSKAHRGAKEYVLAADSPHADNENAEEVAISTRTLNKLSSFHYVTLAPCSVYVLTWNAVS